MKLFIGDTDEPVCLRPSISGLKNRWCPEIVELMERMWAQDHNDRPTMTEVVEELTALVQQYR